MSHIRNNQEIDAMGTLIYMSPECIAGKARLSSDIWSCGIALYMIATRKLPYKYVNES
jgi:serine/threonine protein kinase